MNKSHKLYRFFSSWARNNFSFLQKNPSSVKGFCVYFQRNALGVCDNHLKQLIQTKEQVNLKSENGNHYCTNRNLMHSSFHDFFKKNECFGFCSESLFDLFFHCMVVKNQDIIPQEIKKSKHFDPFERTPIILSLNFYKNGNAWTNGRHV